MGTLNLNRTFSVNEDLNSFAQMLLDNGFKLLIPEKPSTYLFFGLENKVGYVQIDNHGFRFSTVHKPCKECGTGYGLQDYWDGLINPTIENAKQAFTFAPNWANQQDMKAIKKYDNIEDYLQRSIILKYNLITA